MGRPRVPPCARDEHDRDDCEELAGGITNDEVAGWGAPSLPPPVPPKRPPPPLPPAPKQTASAVADLAAAAAVLLSDEVEAPLGAESAAAASHGPKRRYTKYLVLPQAAEGSHRIPKVAHGTVVAKQESPQIASSMSWSATRKVRNRRGMTRVAAGSVTPTIGAKTTMTTERMIA